MNDLTSPMTDRAEPSPITSRRRSLHTATAWVAAAAIMLLSTAIVWRTWREANIMAEVSVLNTARVLAQQTERSFDQTDTLLRSVGQRYRALSSGDRADAENLSERVRRDLPYFPMVARVGVTDSEGRVVFNTGFEEGDLRHPDLSDRDYFQRARAGEQELMFGGPLQARLTGEWSLSLARRLEDDGGRFLGVVFAVLPVETMGELFTRLDLGAHGIVNLRTLDFAQVVRRPTVAAPNGDVGNRNVSKTIRDLMDRQPGLDHYVYKAVAPIDGIERVYAYQKLSHSPFWMTVGRATADFSGNWRESAALLSVLSAAVTWLLLWGASRLDGQNRLLERGIAERTASLAESERFIRTITDALPGMVGYWDADLRNRFANRAYQDWFGKTPQEIRGTHLAELLDAELFAETEPYVRGALRGERQHFERHLTKPSGESGLTWVQYIPDSVEGEVRGYFVLSTDITEFRQAQMLLRRQAAELDDLYNKAPCGYHSLDPQGLIVRINDTELEWFGCTRDEVIGRKRITDFMTPASAAAFAASFPQFLARGSVDELELEFRRKDGRSFPALVSATTIRGDDGNVVMTRSVMVDYTRLRREQNTLREVLAAAPMAVRVATLSDNRIVFMNKAFCELLRRGEDEARGMDAESFYVDPAAFRDIRDSLGRGEPVINRLVELHLPDRPDIPHVWAMASYMLIDYAGQRAVLAWLFDVTALHDARLAAEAANRELDAFAYAVSHDLRAPLRAITGFATALEEDYGGKLDGEAREYLTNITGASTRMRELIEGILQLSRSSMAEMRGEDVDLSALAATVVEDLREADPRRHVECDIAPGLLVRGDKALLGAVMQNLIGNAWKYGAGVPEARILVRGEEAGPFLRVSVTDNGAGFDMRYAGKLFQPFQRLHRQDEFPGIGIGLATVQRIVRRHGGEIGATGAPGQGATFSFTVPRGGDGRTEAP